MNNRALRILTQNCHKEGAVLGNLRGHAEALAHDILLLQEIPPHSPHFPRGFRVYYPSNYDSAETPRTVTLVSNRISPARVSQLFLPSMPDLVVLHIADDSNPPIRIVNIYNDGHTNAALNYMIEHWDNWPAAPDGAHISGDFNLHHPFWGGPRAETSFYDVAPTEHLLDFLGHRGLSLLQEEGLTTYLRGSTTIDLTFGRGNLSSAWVSTEILSPPLFSDHVGLSTTYRQAAALPAPRPTRQFRATDWNLFESCLHHHLEALLPPVEQFSATSPGELESMVEKIERVLHSTIAEAVPLRRCPSGAKPWWSSDIEDLRSTANNDFWRWRQNRNSPTLQQNARMSRNRFKAALRQAERDHSEAKLAEANQFNFWKLYKEVALPKAQTQLPPLLQSDGQRTRTGLETANLLLETWFPLARATAPPHRPPSAEASYADRLTRHHERPAANLTESEIRAAIWSAEPYNSYPQGSFPNQVLRIAWPSMSRYLTNLFQSCLDLGYHPASWKRGQTTPVPKSNGKAKDDPTAYRPITLLPVLTKTMEKVMANRLTHAGLAGALPAEHFGCLPGHSREQAVLALTERVRDSWRRKEVSLFIKTDIKSAFDRACHRSLLAALQQRGIPQRDIQWVSSLLDQRETHVYVDECASSTRTLQEGVPQGSPLSPILWLFYTADLVELLRRQDALCIGWADDISLLVSHKNPSVAAETANELLGDAAEWSRRSGSTFAPAKCEHMLFVPHQRQQHVRPGTLSVQLEGSNIPAVEQTTLVGVTLTPSLSPSNHVRARVAVAERSLLAIRHLSRQKRGLSYSLTRYLCQQVVLAQLDSGSSTWFNCDSDQQQKYIALFDRVQLKCAVAISGGLKAAGLEALEYEACLLPTTLRLQAASQALALKSSTLPNSHGFAPTVAAVRSSTTGPHLSPLARLYSQMNLPAVIETIDHSAVPPDTTARHGRLDLEIANDRQTALRQHANATSTIDSSLEVSAYTDGSLISGHAGAGAVVYCPYLPPQTLSWPLGQQQTVFAAELAAIHGCISNLLDCSLLNSVQKLVIYADNQAALLRATEPSSTSGQYIMLAIQNLISQLLERHPHLHVVFRWVPGHEDVAGNEAADGAAKAAVGISMADMDMADWANTQALADYSQDATLDTTARQAWVDCLKRPTWAVQHSPLLRFPQDPLPASLSSLQTLLKAALADKWHTRWGQSSSSIGLRSIVSRPPGRHVLQLHAHLRRAESSLLTRLRTDRSSLGASLMRIGCAESDRCACGQRETRRHFLLSCPLYMTQRQHLRYRLGARRASDIRSLLSALPDIYGTLEFISATERFPGWTVMAALTDERFEQWNERH